MPSGDVLNVVILTLWATALIACFTAFAWMRYTVAMSVAVLAAVVIISGPESAAALVQSVGASAQTLLEQVGI